MSTRRSLVYAFALVAGAILLAGGVAPAADPSLRRDLSSYFVFAMRHSHTKSLTLRSPCNVGVNCARPSATSTCGLLQEDAPQYRDGSQMAADAVQFSKPGGSVWQVFRNDDSPLDNVTIRHPGDKADGTNVLAPLPLLGDLDNDGTPSCRALGGFCSVDPGDLEVACGFPDPFPACDASRPILVRVDRDCANDVAPGNQQCDLAPGTYGVVKIQNGAKLVLQGRGDYVFCSVEGGKTVRIAAEGARVLVPKGGGFEVSNGSRVADGCGDLTVFVKGGGDVSFGRVSTINARLCAPESLVLLGHQTFLRGQFVGDTVDADHDDTGECCGRCACFDAFDPGTARVADPITLTSGCDLSNVTAVHICGILAPITSQAVDTITVTVPPGAAGSCTVEVTSVPGSFTHVERLFVPTP